VLTGGRSPTVHALFNGWVIKHLAVSLTARPPRAALLVPEPQLIGTDLLGGDWHQVVMRALEASSTFWGGSGSLLVPVGPGGIQMIFRRLLARYDPDVLLAYEPTLDGLARSDQNAFAAWCAANPNAATHPEVRATTFLARHWAAEPLSELYQTLSAHPREDLEHYLSGHPPLPAELTGLPALASRDGTLPSGTAALFAAHRPGEPAPIWHPVSLVDFSALPLEIAVWATARVGTVAAVTQPDGTERTPDDLPIARFQVAASDEAPALELAVLGSAASSGVWTSALALAPAGRSQTGIQPMVRGASRFKPAVVGGGEMADFLLTLGLNRTYGEAAATWVPPALIPSAGKQLAEPYADWLRQAASRGPVRVVSVSLDEATRSATAVLLHQATLAPGQGMPVHGVQFLGATEADQVSLPLARHRWVLPDCVDQTSNVPFEDGLGVAELTGPIPRLASEIVGELEWVVDALVDGTRPMASPAGAALVSPSPQVRVGRDGASWFALDKSVLLPADFGMQLRLARVQVVDPDLPQLLSALAAQDGRSVELSNAGRFYDEAISMAGGLDSTARFLQDPLAGPLLDLFIKPVVKTGGFGFQSAGRRYLRLADMRNELRQAGIHTRTTDTRERLDELTACGIIRLGLVLKCRRCLHTTFYPLDDVGTYFKCTRCPATPLVDSAAWCRTPPHQPALFHALDELFYQALDQGMAGPVGALSILKRTVSGHGFRYALPHVFTDLLTGKQIAEADFFTLRDGTFSIGEAKLNGELAATARSAEREAAKLRGLAIRLQAHEVVFHAPESSWDTKSKEAIRRTFPMGSIPVSLVI
jgi:hypothetical protein